ncbi:Protoporphyrinogen oxidase [Dothidotthia symphoricarpi CBS 119687]|uniref:Protoporphyrinogen oxidase n=1 Tax=Dothidotthia symphoricarpi CBS 119687 TaxID=1392245 RepID=A0A6A6A0R5_9PLEO|nr:Protoporphyrinogen oxidase [Dothidotthia symphoricarpi CBS 119687]KAF2124151.1 Protoporphyrinogen oxidase [Dothidotthia symphoricarpi CBS 119687]
MQLQRYGPAVLKRRTTQCLAGRAIASPPHSHSLLSPRCSALLASRGRRFASTAGPERVAVLGGGIAGLASAYFTAKEFPESKVTLFESAGNVGGWIKSRRVDVGEGNALFELGPRSLRNSTVTASLIQELDLIDEVLFTEKTAPGAKNRFIFYPDRLNRLPSEAPSLSSLFDLWRTGILSGAFGLIKEPMMPSRPSLLSDESVGAFLARRVDKRIADNIVSAVFHGIYAGDVWNLSAKTLLSLAWQLEGKYGSALGGFFKLQSEDEGKGQLTIAHPRDVEVARSMNEEIDLDEDFASELKDASMYTFRNGLQTLVTGLTERLEEMGVEIKTNTPVQTFKPASSGEKGVEIVAGPPDSTTTQTFDLAISSLRNPDLTPYVTVQTVNLYFATPPASLLPVQGFGYLIPQSIPFEQNPERALGVIFDSSAIVGQDTAPGTKLTIMMGGHWWDGWAAYPTEEEGLAMARAVLKRHINITEEPVHSIVNLSHECIPQYTVGYEDRLRDFADGIASEFKGRLRVVGSQFNGVGVNDCITGAWNVARGLRGEGWKGDSVGLERVRDRREWVKVAAREMVWSGRGSIKGAVGGGRGGIGGGV